MGEDVPGATSEDAEMVAELSRLQEEAAMEVLKTEETWDASHCPSLSYLGQLSDFIGSRQLILSPCKSQDFTCRGPSEGASCAQRGLSRA